MKGTMQNKKNQPDSKKTPAFKKWNITPDNPVIYTITQLIKRFGDDKLPQLGASLAYFFLLSIFPFLIFLNALLGFLNLSISNIILDVARIAPDQVVNLMNSYLSSVVSVRSTGLLSVGLIATLFSSSNAVNMLMISFNTAYRIEESRNPIIQKILSIFFTLLLGMAIVTSLVLPALGRNIAQQVAQFFLISEHFVELWVILRWVVVFTIIFFVIASLYHFGPSQKTTFRKAIPGTIFTTLAWAIISYGFGYYVNSFGNYSAVYGSLGAVIVLMVWFYLTGMIIMLGAELNQIIYEQRTHPHTYIAYGDSDAQMELMMDHKFQELTRNIKDL